MNELIKVGAKVRAHNWGEGNYAVVTAVGETNFLATHVPKNPFGEVRYGFEDTTWSVYEEPKKTVMMYPALYKNDFNFYVGGYLFSNEKDAKEYCPGFIKLLTDRGIEIEIKE